MFQIRLGAQEDVDPLTDPLGRTSIGFVPGMSEAEAWEAGRGAWVFKADRVLDEDEVQIVDPDSVILAVARIIGVVKAGGRYAIRGELLESDQRVGNPSPKKHPSQNPITYI